MTKVMIIYVATNTVNGKQYVGQTVQTLHKRKISHLTASKCCVDKMAIHYAIKKYGKENFTWEVLETCADVDTLNEAEVKWIKKLNTFKSGGYNETMGGDSGYVYSEAVIKKMIGRKVSEETRKKLSIGSMGHIVSIETRNKLSEFNKGKKLSEEHKRKIGKSNKGKKLSEKQKRQVSKSLKAYWKKKNDYKD